MRGCTIFCGTKPCRQSLTPGSHSCGSNVNCKLQTWPRGRGHVTFCGLRIAVSHEKPDAKGLYYLNKTGVTLVPSKTAKGRRQEAGNSQTWPGSWTQSCRETWGLLPTMAYKERPSLADANRARGRRLLFAIYPKWRACSRARPRPKGVPLPRFQV